MKKVRIKSLPKAQSGLEVKMAAGLGFNANVMPWPIMAGQFAQPDIEVNKTLKPIDRKKANLEAENGETAFADLTGDGILQLYTIGGERHYNGGTPLNLPEDSFIFSRDNSMKIKGDILTEFGKPKGTKKKFSPAELSKQYDINEFRKVLADPDSDKLQRDTAEMMIANYNLKLAKLGLVQESKKGFPDGIPKISLPYVEMMGVNPADYLQPQGDQDVPDADNMKYGGGLPKAQFGKVTRQYSTGNPQTDSQIDKLINYPNLTQPELDYFYNKAKNVSNVNKDYLKSIYNNLTSKIEQTQFLGSKFGQKRTEEIGKLQIMLDELKSTGASKDKIAEVENRIKDIQKIGISDFASNYGKHALQTGTTQSAWDEAVHAKAKPLTFNYLSELERLKDQKLVDQRNLEAEKMEKNIGSVYSKLYKKREAMNSHQDLYNAEDFVNINQQFEDAAIMLKWAEGLQKQRKADQNILFSEAGTSPYHIVSNLYNEFGKKYGHLPEISAKVQPVVKPIVKQPTIPVASVAQDTTSINDTVPASTTAMYNLTPQDQTVDTVMVDEEFKLGGVYKKGGGDKKIKYWETSKVTGNRRPVYEDGTKGPVEKAPVTTTSKPSTTTGTTTTTGDESMNIYTPPVVEWIGKQKSSGKKAILPKVTTVGVTRPKLQHQSTVKKHNIYGNVTWDQAEQDDFKARVPWVYETKPDFDPTDETVVGTWPEDVGKHKKGTPMTKGESDVYWFQKEYDKRYPGYFGQKEQGTGFDAAMGAHTFSVPGFTEEEKPKAEGEKPKGPKAGSIPVEHLDVPNYPGPKADWWLQDKIATAGAFGDLMRIKKYNPWQATPGWTPYEGTFYDPTRELAANAEMVNQGIQAAGAFGSPQSVATTAAYLQTQGAPNVANIMARYNNLNVQEANRINEMNTGAFNQFAQQRANNATQLFDKQTIANQQFDNAKNMARQNLRQSYINAITNRANTYNLNTIYPGFNVDPSTGGLIDATAYHRMLNSNAKSTQTPEDYLNALKNDGGYDKDEIKMLFNAVYGKNGSGVETDPYAAAKQAMLRGYQGSSSDTES